jgi:opacity protein-like surface antigen
MKKLLITTTALLLAGNVSAKELKNLLHNSYITAEVGAFMPKKFTGAPYRDFGEPKNAFAYGIGWGQHINENFRTDITFNGTDFSSEINVQQVHFKTKYKTFSSFLNGYYDFTSFNKFTPYLTLGIGLATLKPSIVDSGRIGQTTVKYTHDRNLAWRMGVGLKRKITESIDVDFNYKYTDLGNNKFTYITKDQNNNVITNELFRTKIRGQSFNVGLTYNF